MAGSVTVASKHPLGLILHIDEMVDYDEPLPGGGHTKRKIARRRPETVVINGCSVPHGEAPKWTIIHGAALTYNVDADFFAKWLEQNKDTDLVKNRVIFHHEKTDSAQARAKENEKALSGLEPILPDEDKRIPRRIKTMDSKAA